MLPIISNSCMASLKADSKRLAYVDDSSSEEIAAMKGTPTEPGKDSPFRNREIEEI